MQRCVKSPYEQLFTSYELEVEFCIDSQPEVHLTSFSNFNIVQSSEDAFKILNVVNLKYLLLAPSNSDPLSRSWLLSRVLLQIAGVLAVLICKLVYVLIVNNMILKYDLT